jgi:hypothetical protein
MSTEYRGEVWQGGMRVAMAQGQTWSTVNMETAHYAAMYSQDGPVIVKHFSKKPKKRWKLITSYGDSRDE